MGPKEIIIKGVCRLGWMFPLRDTEIASVGWYPVSFVIPMSIANSNVFGRYPIAACLSVQH